MKLYIDERERDLYSKCLEIARQHFLIPFVQIVSTVLHIGDIYITTDEDQHLCVIERKSIADLLASINDTRYKEQSHRLTHSTRLHPHTIVYLIEGMMNQTKSYDEKKRVYSAIASLSLYKGFSVFRSSCLQETAELLVWIASKIGKNYEKKIYPMYLSGVYGHPNCEPVVVEAAASTPLSHLEEEMQKMISSNKESQEAIIESSLSSQELTLPPFLKSSSVNVLSVKKSKKENITPDNIGLSILSQIPYVNITTATAVMEKYDHSLKSLVQDLQANPDCLKDMSMKDKDGKMRKISSTALKNIRVYLMK